MLVGVVVGVLVGVVVLGVNGVTVTVVPPIIVGVVTTIGVKFENVPNAVGVEVGCAVGVGVISSASPENFLSKE